MQTKKVTILGGGVVGISTGIEILRKHKGVKVVVISKDVILT